MNIPLITFILKGATTFWAFLLMAVTAAQCSYSTIDATNAVLACSVIALVYFIVFWILTFRLPSTIFLSMIVDTSILGFLFIFAIGSVGAQSSWASTFRYYDGFKFASLGLAVIGLGWIFVLLLLGLLIFQVAYTLSNFGGSMDTWRTPFFDLINDGPRRSSGHSYAGGQGQVPMSTV